MAEPLEAPHLRIGVTGHRRLPEDFALSEAVLAALYQACVAVRGTAGLTCKMEVISSLAEGADSLVAELVLAQADGVLRAALPLPQDAYERAFTGSAALRTFRALLARASTVEVICEAVRAEGAYVEAGIQVMRRCDVLLALWDGLPPRGPSGTGAIVALARAEEKPMIWIEAAPPYCRHAERLERLGR